ncbi:hypothetical protein HN511_04070 [bacterium]|nr:hypothetical protein [bacterium]
MKDIKTKKRKRPPQINEKKTVNLAYFLHQSLIRNQSTQPETPHEKQKAYVKQNDFTKTKSLCQL